MAQSTVLTAGTTGAASSDITLAAGDTVTLGIFSAAPGALPGGVRFTVYQATPGADNPVARLDNNSRTTVLSGPGTYRISRPAYDGTAMGVFTED